MLEQHEITLTNHHFRKFNFQRQAFRSHIDDQFQFLIPSSENLPCWPNRIFFRTAPIFTPSRRTQIPFPNTHMTDLIRLQRPHWSPWTHSLGLVPLLALKTNPISKRTRAGRPDAIFPFYLSTLPKFQRFLTNTPTTNA